MNRQPLVRYRAWFARLALFGAVAAAGGTAALTASDSSAGDVPAPSATAAAEVSPPLQISAPAPLSEPSSLSGPGEVWIPEKQRTLAPGLPVDADPVRVHTGDGDCLNVRPSPGTAFESEPFTCLPEDTLLWLYGPAQEADGETWRYALGSGWVATKYTQAAPRPAVRLPASGLVTLYQEAPNGRDPGSEIVAGRFDMRSGQIGPTFSGQHVEYGLGSRVPDVSPSGRFISFTNGDGTGQYYTVLVGDMETGQTRVIENATSSSWSRNDRLMLTIFGNPACTPGCDWRLGYYDARTDRVVDVGLSNERLSGPVWAADGLSFYAARYSDDDTEEAPVINIALDGTVTEIASGLTRDLGFYEAQPSPSGKSFLLGEGFGKIKVIDIATGALRDVERAPQRELPGRCGGTFSVASGWLDEQTIFYHERSSSDRTDGITIGSLRTGERRVLPFFNVQDLRSPEPGLLTFATWAGYDGLAFSVTFVVDIATGDSIPVATGAGAGWAH